jgi:hypothetical protein
MWPDDIIQNTILAFAVSATSASGYSGASPTGRYFAPANGPDCIEIAQTVGNNGVTNQTTGLGQCAPVRWSSPGRPSQGTTFGSPSAPRSSAAPTSSLRGVPERVQPPNFLPLASVNGNLTTGIGGLHAHGFQLTNLNGADQRRLIQLVARVNW